MNGDEELTPQEGETASQEGGETASQEGVVLFTTTERLQQILNMLAACTCVLVLASSKRGTLRWWAFGLLAYSLSNMALRHALGYMQDQRRACQFCGWWSVLLANLMWMIYHCIVVEASTLLNKSVYVLMLHFLFVICDGCRGALVTSWAQRICMTVLAVAHNIYANSFVPIEIKLFSDVEAGILVGFAAMIALSLVSLVPQLVTFMMRTDDAEARAQRAQKVVVELDRHVAALETARRDALVNGGTQVQRRRTTPVRPTEPSMLGGPLGSVREE